MKSIKKIVLLVAALIVFAGSANAKILSFGIKAGANFNKLSLSHQSGPNAFNDKSNSAGWEAGVMMEANIPVVGIGFDLSLMYARMNNQGDFYGMANNQYYEIYDASKNFIMIPLNVKYKISLPVVGSLVAPYIFTGPNFVFDLNSKTLDYVKNKTCQVAWNVGLGLEFIKHLQIGASYNFGLGKIGNSIINYTTGITPTQYTVKNNYWMVTAAYLF